MDRDQTVLKSHFRQENSSYKFQLRHRTIENHSELESKSEIFLLVFSFQVCLLLAPSAEQKPKCTENFPFI